MLHKDCPSMGLVVNCGFMEKNCFGTDIFPVRIQNSHLIKVSATRRDPFKAYCEFKKLFLEGHLPNVLEYGGKVILVFGRRAFEMLRKKLSLRKVGLGRNLDHLKIYCEMVSLKTLWTNLFQEPSDSGNRIRRLVIHTYHLRSFLPDEPIPIYELESGEEIDSDMKEDEKNEELERMLFYARRMDESFNLAAHLTDINLSSETYWTDYVMENYGESSDMDEDEDEERF